MRRKQRIQSGSLAQQGPAHTARCLTREVRQRPAGGLASGLRPRTGLSRGPLEGVQQVDVRESRVLEPLRFERKTCPDAPCELDPLGTQLRGNPFDLAQRHTFLERPLQSTARPRGLTGMHAIEHERLGQVVALGLRQQPRPQVVVLALEILGVVAKPVPLEHIALDEHAWMEERRAEERGPAHRLRAGGHQMQGPRTARRVDVEHGAAGNSDRRARDHALELSLQPPRKRDVVRVEPGDVASTSLVEPAVE